MISKSSLLNSNGRMNMETEISQKRLKENDDQGKEIALRLLTWILENQPEFFKLYFGDFKNISFKIVEKFAYGDIIIFVDGKSYDCEIECRASHHFKGNFYMKTKYKDGVNVPLKHNIQNANGIYLILDKEEVYEALKDNHLPSGFMIILTNDIKIAKTEKAPLKNGQVDPENADNKYKIPHHKTKKYGFGGNKFEAYN